jgi:ABC-type uncharacterized transport system YnjBCD substrate-binding protein
MNYENEVKKKHPAATAEYIPTILSGMKGGGYVIMVPISGNATASCSLLTNFLFQPTAYKAWKYTCEVLYGRKINWKTDNNI